MAHTTEERSVAKIMILDRLNNQQHDRQTHHHPLSRLNLPSAKSFKRASYFKELSLIESG